MPGSKNTAQIHAQYLAPWAVYRSGISTNDNLGAVANVTQVLDLTNLISAASSELWVTAERTAGAGTITLSLVRENEGTLIGVPYQVVAQQAGIDHKQEHKFTGIMPGRYRVLVTGISGNTWTLHTTSISKLAFASLGGGGGGGGTIEVPTVPFTWVSGSTIEVQAWSEGAGWIIDGNVAPFAGSSFTNIVYTGDNFSSLSFQNLSIQSIDAASSDGGELNVTACGNLADIDGFDALSSLTTLVVSGNSDLNFLSGFPNLISGSDFTIANNAILDTIAGFGLLTDLLTLTITNNPALTAVNGFGSLTTVESIIIKDNPNLTSVAGLVSFTSVITTADFRNNLFPEAEVDRILAAAVAGGFVGTLRLDGTGNAAPSEPDGFADVATLRGNGATVYVNGEISLQLRGGAGLGIGSSNVFGSDRHVAYGNVCLTTNGYTIYAIDTTDPDNPSVISSIGVNPAGGGGATYSGPTTITMAGFSDPDANGVYTFVSANFNANVFGGTYAIAAYVNPSGYILAVSPPTGGGNRVDIYSNAATWDGTTLADNGAGVFVDYAPDPNTLSWRGYATQGTLLSPQPTVSDSGDGPYGDAAWSGGGLDGSSVIASMTRVGTNLFVCYEGGFLETLDVTDPSSMAWIGHFDTGFSGELQCGAWAPVKDNVLYQNSPMPGLSDQGSILAYDISDPSNVSLLARVRTPNARGGGGLAIIGNMLWACDYFSHFTTGNQAVFYGLDITTPASMGIDVTVDCTEDSTVNSQNGGFIGRPFEPWGMCKFGDILYVLDDYIIQSWDVSNPMIPVKVSTVWNENDWSDTEGFCVDEVRGILISAVSGFNGPANRGGSVIAFSLGDPGNPAFVSEIFPLGAGASRFSEPDTTRRLIYGSVGGIFNIFSY